RARHPGRLPLQPRRRAAGRAEDDLHRRVKPGAGGDGSRAARAPGTDPSARRGPMTSPTPPRLPEAGGVVVSGTIPAATWRRRAPGPAPAPPHTLGGPTSSSLPVFRLAGRRDVAL